VKVNQDVRVFGSYAELSNTVTVLSRQAARANRQGRADLALALYREAQVQRSLAAGLRQTLRTTGLRTTAERPAFAYGAALRGEIGRDADLRRAQGAKDRRDSAEAHDATTQLTGVALVWTAGLVLFTFAQIAPERTRPRAILARSGFAVATGATILTLLAW
jgi:hypothetical protein